MDELRRLKRLQQSYRYDYPASWTYKAGLVLLVVAYILLILAPNVWFAFSVLTSGDSTAGAVWEALLRVVGATSATLLVVVMVVRDFRGQRPFYRSILLLVANLLLLATVVLPLLL